jgi:hypothetical protein
MPVVFAGVRNKEYLKEPVMTQLKELERKFSLDLPNGRYDTVALTWAWLRVFQKTDDAKGLSPSELVKKALDDVTSGRITYEDIKKAKSKAPAAEAAEPKAKADKEEVVVEKKPAKKHEKSKK